MQLLARCLLSTLFLWLGMGASAVQAEDPIAPVVEFIGTGVIAASCRDCSQSGALLEDGTPANQFGGVSAIDAISGTNRYLVLSDRGPKDGAVTYACRFHEIELSVQSGAPDPVRALVVRTSLFTDPTGKHFPGLASALYPDARLAARLDPEGLRIGPAGDMFVSDEYGPAIHRFSANGVHSGELAVPAELRIENPSADGSEENKNNQRGRKSNRGMEGLALSPCGRFLTGLMQSPLLQDMQTTEDGGLAGFNSRLLQIDLETGMQKQLVYQQEKEGHKLHEILAVDHEKFLVIEQDGQGGEKAGFKQIVLIDTKGATALAAGAVLPADRDLAPIQPVRKEPLIDLLDPRFGLAGVQMPEKIEGLSWGPLLSDGSRMLVVATDNDFRNDQDTLFFVFSVRL